MLTIVFDLDGTLIDTAPDLIDALNFTLAGLALPTVPYARARSLIGGGAWGMIERALILEGRRAPRRRTSTPSTRHLWPTMTSISPTDRALSRA